MFTFFTPGVINEKWMDYQATWPLDLSCCIIVIILDFIRRVRRMDFHVHDAAPMFSMSLLQFTVGKFILVPLIPN